VPILRSRGSGGSWIRAFHMSRAGAACCSQKGRIRMVNVMLLLLFLRCVRMVSVPGTNATVAQFCYLLITSHDGRLISRKIEAVGVPIRSLFVSVLVWRERSEL